MRRRTVRAWASVTTLAQLAGRAGGMARGRADARWAVQGLTWSQLPIATCGFPSRTASWHGATVLDQPIWRQQPGRHQLLDCKLLLDGPRARPAHPAAQLSPAGYTCFSVPFLL